MRGGRLAITDRRAERRTGRNLSGGAGGEWNADRLGYRARKTGWYSLQVSTTRPGFGSYSLRIRRSR